MRFVIDAVPAQDELTETVVLDDGVSGWGADKVAMFELTGLIADMNRPGLITQGANPVAEFVESLEKARDDSRVRAVVVRLNSPGGTVTASDTIYREVMRFREETGKPVVMTMSDLAASGAFYVACAGDRIIASPTTTTGSIGVIIQTFNFSEGMRKIGISADAITSGPNKAMGSPFEPEVPEHRELLQEMVNEFYGRFRLLVEERRPNVSPGDLDWITDGRVISGARAAEVGLVDQTGDLHDAFETAKELAGLSRAQLVKYHRPVEHVGSAYASSPSAPAMAQQQVNLLQLNMYGGAGFGPTPGFYYLWDPSIDW